MKVTPKPILAFFIAVLILHCVFIAAGIQQGATLTKLLLLPLLMTALFLCAKPQGGKPVLAMLALFFSFAGDFLLARDGDLFFLAGMLAFVFTHVCNGLLFIRLKQRIAGILPAQWTLLLILLILSACVYLVLQHRLGAFRMPVLIYMGIISAMTFTAAGVKANPLYRLAANRFLVPGAVFFVVSDTLLALNKFLLHEVWINVAVMLTYGLAQYFLTRGYLLVFGAQRIETTVAEAAERE